MSPTKKATVQVVTADLRHALASVFPHHNRQRRDDAIALHRVRLTFANGTLFVGATNGKTTALARVGYLPDTDSRGSLWEPDDGPMIVELQPRHSKLITGQFSARASASDVDQVIAIDIDATAAGQGEGIIDFTDIGGLFSDGESLRLKFGEPHDAFPDLIDITGRAFAGVKGESGRPRPLVQDGRIMGLFRDASVQYGSDLRIRAIGDTEGAGFLVQAGAYFAGTVESRPDDDGLKSRAKTDMEWLRILNPGKLAIA